MICVSLAEPSLNEFLKALKKVDMAEIRLDMSDLSDEDIKQLFSLRKKLIATCRLGKYSDPERKEILLKAIESGADFVDVEIEASSSFKKDIITAAKKEGCKVIISYHNYEETPSKKELDKIIKQCFDQQADIAKVASMIKNKKDASRILSVYENNEKDIISIGMGEIGKITRLSSLYLGAPFTYASLDSGKETAKGQFDKKTLTKLMELINHA